MFGFDDQLLRSHVGFAKRQSFPKHHDQYRTILLANFQLKNSPRRTVVILIVVIDSDSVALQRVQLLDECSAGPRTLERTAGYLALRAT
jgi:hypothetical protein